MLPRCKISASLAACHQQKSKPLEKSPANWVSSAGIAGGVIAALLLAICLFCCLRRRRRNKSPEQPAAKQQKPKPAKQPKQPRKPLLGFLGRGKKEQKASGTEAAFLEVPHDSESSTGGSFTETAVLNPGTSVLTSESIILLSHVHSYITAYSYMNAALPYTHHSTIRLPAANVFEQQQHWQHFPDQISGQLWLPE